MNEFEKKFNQASLLQAQLNKVIKELIGIVEEHLGDDWYVTYHASDGFLLGSPDAYNFRISTYFEAQEMSREQAIEYIEANPFN